MSVVGAPCESAAASASSSFGSSSGSSSGIGSDFWDEMAGCAPGGAGRTEDKRCPPAGEACSGGGGDKQGGVDEEEREGGEGGWGGKDEGEAAGERSEDGGGDAAKHMDEVPQPPAAPAGVPVGVEDAPPVEGLGKMLLAVGGGAGKGLSAIPHAFPNDPRVSVPCGRAAFYVGCMVYRSAVSAGWSVANDDPACTSKRRAVAAVVDMLVAAAVELHLSPGRTNPSLPCGAGSGRGLACPECAHHAATTLLPPGARLVAGTCEMGDTAAACVATVDAAVADVLHPSGWTINLDAGVDAGASEGRGRRGGAAGGRRPGVAGGPPPGNVRVVEARQDFVNGVRSGWVCSGAHEVVRVDNRGGSIGPAMLQRIRGTVMEWSATSRRNCDAAFTTSRMTASSSRRGADAAAAAAEKVRQEAEAAGPAAGSNAQHGGRRKHVHAVGRAPAWAATPANRTVREAAGRGPPAAHTPNGRDPTTVGGKVITDMQVVAEGMRHHMLATSWLADVLRACAVVEDASTLVRWPEEPPSTARRGARSMRGEAGVLLTRWETDIGLGGVGGARTTTAAADAGGHSRSVQTDPTGAMRRMQDRRQRKEKRKREEEEGGGDPLLAGRAGTKRRRKDAAFGLFGKDAGRATFHGVVDEAVASTAAASMRFDTTGLPGAVGTAAKVRRAGGAHRLPTVPTTFPARMLAGEEVATARAAVVVAAQTTAASAGSNGTSCPGTLALCAATAAAAATFVEEAMLVADAKGVYPSIGEFVMLVSNAVIASTLAESLGGSATVDLAAAFWESGRGPAGSARP